MITIKLNIKNTTDSTFIKNKQLNYSYVYRKLYNNINFIDDKNYLSKFKIDFNLNDIEIRSLISEVKMKFNQIKVGKEKLEKDIVDLEKEIIYLKTLQKSNKNTRKIFKLNNKLSYKNKLLSKDIVFGGKVLLKKLSFLNNNKIKNHNEIIKIKNEYSNSRILPFYILGEANQNGNRFFKFDLNNNKVIYKPKFGIKINIEFSHYKSYEKTLNKLQEQIDLKLISVSVRLSEKFIYLLFDDEQLNGFSLNVIDRTKEVKEIKNSYNSKEIKTEQIKEIYKKYYKEQEQSKLKGKLNYRYVAFDTNPDYIGCSILDKVNDDFKVICTFNYDLSEFNNLKLNKSSSDKEQIHLNNKRKHGIYHIWKDLFEIVKYYNCGHIVMENLNKINTDLGNKVSNRKVNNVWYRTLSTNLINKYCNKFGLIKIEINPCYSSFIGNLTNNFIDPVNSSIEIGRRGIFKYKKNNFYPKINIGTIMDTMSRLNNIQHRDVSYLKDCNNWIEMYQKVRESGLRYRATIEDSQYQHNVVNNLIHSKIKKICFLKENNLSLHKI